MIIETTHVGKRIRRSNWPGGSFVDVTAVGEGHFLGRSDMGAEFAYPRNSDWVLVEPKKKPSDRIRDIDQCLAPLPHELISPDVASLNSRLAAVIQYLDEQAEAANDK